MNQEDRMFSIGVQSVDLNGFSQNGRVLDIGGGGEGIIGQILGEKVIAIDSRCDELEEAAEGPLKIIMDARELKFLNNTFDGITSFFTLMYIEKQYHQNVFEEIYRVLKEEGNFVIWDVTIPQYPGGNEDIFVVPLEIKLKEKIVSTAYGVMWDKAEQDKNYFMKLCEKVGFELVEEENLNQIYYIKFKKKASEHK